MSVTVAEVSTRLSASTRDHDAAMRESSRLVHGYGGTSESAGRKSSALAGIMKTALLGTVVGVGAGFLAAAGKGLSFNNTLEQTRARINAFTKDAGKTAEILEMVRDRANRTPFSFEAMATAAAGLMPAAKSANLALEELIGTAEILAASNPAEGLEGAAFALREAVSGDWTSIIERFNLPRTAINALKEEGLPAIEIVRQAMLGMGLDADLVAKQAETMQGRFSTFLDTLIGVAAKATEPIFERLSAGLGGINEWLVANEPAITAFGVAIADALSNMADWLGVHLPPLLTWFAGIWRNEITPALQFIADRVRDQVIPAFQSIATWVSQHGEAVRIFFGITLVAAFGAWAISAAAAALATLIALGPLLPILIVLGLAVAAFALAWESNFGGIREITRGVVLAIILIVTNMGVKLLEVVRWINTHVFALLINSMRGMALIMALIGQTAGAKTMTDMADGMAKNQRFINDQLFITQNRLSIFAQNAGQLGWLAGSSFSRNFVAGSALATQAANENADIRRAAATPDVGSVKLVMPKMPSMPATGVGGGGGAGGGAATAKSAIEAAADMTSKIAAAVKAGVDALRLLGDFRLPENFARQVEVFATAVDRVMMRLQTVALKYGAKGLEVTGQFGDASGKVFAGLTAAFSLFTNLSESGNRILNGPAQLAVLADQLSTKVVIIMNKLGDKIPAWGEFASTKISQFAEASGKVFTGLSTALGFFTQLAGAANIISGPVALASLADQLSEKLVIVMNKLGARIPLWDEFATGKIAAFATASGTVVTTLKGVFDLFLALSTDAKSLASPQALADLADTIAEKLVYIMNRLGARIPAWDEFATSKMSQFAKATGDMVTTLTGALGLFDKLATIDALPSKGVLDALFTKLDEWLDLLEGHIAAWQIKASKTTSDVSAFVGSTVNGLAGAFGPLSDLGSKLDSLPSKGVIEFFFGKIDAFLSVFSEYAVAFQGKATKVTSELAGYVGGTVSGIGNAVGVLGDLGSKVDALPSKGVIVTLFQALDSWIDEFGQKAAVWAGRATKDTVLLAGYIGDIVGSVGRSLKPLSDLVDFKAPTGESIRLFFLALDEVIRIFALRSQEWKSQATDEVAKLAANIGAVMDGVNKALDPITKMGKAQEITPGQIEGAMANVWLALHHFNEVMKSGELQGDWKERAVAFAQGVGSVFSSVQDALSVLGGVGGGESGGVTVFQMFRDAFDKTNENSLVHLWQAGFDAMANKTRAWYAVLKFELLTPAFADFAGFFAQVNDWETNWTSKFDLMADAVEDWARRVKAAYSTVGDPGGGGGGGGGGQPPYAPPPSQPYIPPPSPPPGREGPTINNPIYFEGVQVTDPDIQKALAKMATFHGKRNGATG